MILASAQLITLIAETPRFRTSKVSVDPLTDRLTIRLRRPTTLAPLAWNTAATVRVSLVLVLDGVEHRATGQVSGGIRARSDGTEVPFYELRYAPTVQFGQKAWDYIATTTRNAEGFYNDVPLTRIGETASTVEGYVELELLRGTVETELLLATTRESLAPTIRHKNPVTFDAATSATEGAGDGVLSLTHTSTGSDRAAFGGVSWRSVTAGSTSLTYAGTGMTEQWDVQNVNRSSAGYTIAGQTTGAQTVTSTLVDTAPGDQNLGVISMTTVDQTTPVGTAATGTGTTSPASVTVGSVGADDLVVDNFASNPDNGEPTAGADQTLRNTQDGAETKLRESSQVGTAGGVMSWTFSPGGAAWALGAIAFKPVGAAGAVVGKIRTRQLALTGAGL